MATDLELALDSDTPADKLLKLWNNSRSVKVRKAIASNPNASPVVLTNASRLYLKEVLQNPGFSLLEMFSDDWEIRDLSNAYNDPWKWITEFKSGARRSMWNGYVPRKTLYSDRCCSAVLFSPQLDASSLSYTLDMISTEAFKRVIKCPHTKSKIRSIYVNSTGFNSKVVFEFSPEEIISLNKLGVISVNEAYQGLRLIPAGTHTCANDTILRYLHHLIKIYTTSVDNEEREDVLSVLLHLSIAFRSSKNLKTLLSFDSDESAEMYVALLKKMAKASESKKSVHPACSKTLNAKLSRAINVVGDTVADYFCRKYLGKKVTSEGISSLYHRIQSDNLDTLALLAPRIGLFKNDVVVVSQCSLDVKEWVCRKKLFATWTTRNEDNKDLVKIFDEVNEAIYQRDGVGTSLLFDRESVRGVIVLK